MPEIKNTLATYDPWYFGQLLLDMVVLGDNP
jgi:hypothetical protein